MEVLLIVLGLVGSAVALCLKKQQDEPSQLPTRERIESVSNPSFTPGEIPIAQENTKQVLVLVISASQVEFLEPLKDKNHIDVSEGEQLYQITRYLWLGSETELSQKRANINKYSVAKGAESEYNIYLVEIKLKQDDEGFKPNVNQLDRYDAFRKLADLAGEVKVSDRLQIEAYENLEVYNR
ncbi:hypothetical protein Osc7112_2186 [Oscillatoria nigro-viridis PCC 7112]|uniref:Uncharacterized protein n=1 Tax=Phormidium nigroviride PCC 7112 TaxID=179408 RepID=K9VHF2_9CYAN|nr:hypothetical protein [Oscillatoria nigro-viridis]AFZ06650.1 hypothetical protein Osc7112_2186 [Oscillatoria nigro-viridis PCC 7112]